MTATQSPLRRAHLASYLRELVNDVAAQGKIAKIEGNPVEVAAVALMSGSIAVLETMWRDVASFAGDAKTHAKAAARPILAAAAAHSFSALMDKFLGK